MLTVPMPLLNEQVMPPRFVALTLTVSVTDCPVVICVADAERLTFAACTCGGNTAKARIKARNAHNTR